MSSSSLEDVEEQTFESIPQQDNDKTKLARLLMINESDECTESEAWETVSLPEAIIGK